MNGRKAKALRSLATTLARRADFPFREELLIGSTASQPPTARKLKGGWDTDKGKAVKLKHRRVFDRTLSGFALHIGPRRFVRYLKTFPQRPGEALSEFEARVTERCKALRDKALELTKKKLGRIVRP